MPSFSLLGLLASYRDLDPFVQIGYPLFFVLAIALARRMRHRQRAEALEADREANLRLAFEVAQREREAAIHKAVKSYYRDLPPAA